MPVRSGTYASCHKQIFAGRQLAISVLLLTRARKKRCGCRADFERAVVDHADPAISSPALAATTVSVDKVKKKTADNHAKPCRNRMPKRHRER
jgi:hypothetical protein